MEGAICFCQFNGKTFGACKNLQKTMKVQVSLKYFVVVILSMIFINYAHEIPNIATVNYTI